MGHKLWQDLLKKLRGGEPPAPRRELPPNPLEQKVQDAIARGDVSDAIAEVSDFLRYDKLDPDLHTRLHELLLLQGDKGATLEQGQQWIVSLVRADRARHAVAALRELRAVDPGFEIEDASTVVPVASAAFEQGEFHLAGSLLRNFDRRFPGHEDRPVVYFLGARIMSEQARQHDKAAELLRAVLKRFPNHHVAHQVKTYLKVLDAMMARA